METYKKFSEALEEADGGIVVRCGELYVVGMQPSSEIAVINPNGYTTGHVTVSNLDNIGDANNVILNALYKALLACPVAKGHARRTTSL